MAFVVGFGVIAFVLLLLLAAAVSRIRVRVRYARSGVQDHLVVVVHAFYGAYRYKITVPGVAIRGGEILFEKKSSSQIVGKSQQSRPTRRIGSAVFKSGRQTLPWLKYMLRKVECTRFRLDFRVGTGDAVSTAIVSGALWSVYGFAIAAVGKYLHLKTAPYGAVRPVYHNAEFSAVWEADFRIRAGTFAATLLFGGIRTTALLKSWNNWRHLLKEPQHS